MNNTTIPDMGNISVTINDATAVVSWQSGSTAQAIATQLQSQLQQAGGGFLQVTRSGSTLSLSSSIASADANWPILYSITDTSSQTPSFTLSDTGMSGGSNPTVVAPTVSPGATLLYSYSIPAFNPTNMAASGYLANGNLQNVTDSVMGNWSYQYDDLNRLKQANASANPQTGFAPYGAAQLNWGYDSFGDYKGTTLSGTTGFTMPQVAYSYNGSSLQNGTVLTGVANNRIDGYNYDASGDLLSDPLGGSYYYTYDAEGRVSTVGTSVKYVYDAEGRRVAKESVSGGSATVTNQYVLGLGGEQVSELNGSGSWVHSNVYAGGKLLATYNPTGLHFHFTDWLGTNRIQTSGTGMLEESCLSLPFGDMLNCSGSDSTEQHFTGKERDTESGLDYFGARYYASSMGRWMSPDWADKPEAVPYSSLDNPQSLNLYGYVLNNPLSHADSDGHCCDLSDVVNFVGGAVNAWGSDNLAGVGRVDQTTSAGMAGARVGDFAAAVQGVAETIQGAGAVLGGGAEALVTSPAAGTGVGVVVPAAGAAVAVVGAAEVVHGVATAGTAVTNLMKAGGNFSSGTKQGAKDAAGGKCQNCGVETTPGQKSQKGVTPPGTEGQTDHIQPRSKGGTNDPSNAQHLCRDCNIKKSDKVPNQ